MAPAVPTKPRKKRQPSSIDRLDPRLQSVLADLRRRGRTVTEIHEHLSNLGADVSRSAIGRHVKTMAEIGEEMRRAEHTARFLVEEFGEATDERVARANMRILQGAILRLQTERPLDDDGQPVEMDAGEAKELSLVLQRLVSAQRMDADRSLKLRAEAKRQAQEDAAQAVEAVAKRAGGLTRKTIDEIKAEILGIKP